jgi:protein O-GlcNAc transferase
MTTANVMQLLNFAVRCMEPEEVYCKVGCFQGATLIGAMLEQPGRLAYAVDNFSFDADGTGIDRLIANLSAFDLTEQVFFSGLNFEEFFFNHRSK